jgi:hypothetical protein
MFTSGNFLGSSSGQRNDARDLYALLIGSVNTISATARLNGDTGQYIYNGQSYENGRLQQMDTFVQDNWRIRPNLSINLGLRYAVQPSFTPLNGSYSTATLDSVWGISGYRPGCDLSNATQDNCSLFQPGNATFPKPTYINFGKGVKAYNTDYNNWAPSIGLNWQPGSRGRLLTWIFGDENNERSVSAGWARAYERHGMSDFTGVFSANPGININANRNEANGNILIGTTDPRLLFRNGYLGAQPYCSQSGNSPGCLIDQPSYPISNNVATGSVNVFDPNIQVPFSDNFTVGLARGLTRKTAFEIRYVGTRSHELWTRYDYNEANIIENGFLQEYRNAQANLQSHIAGGCGTTGNPACSFAYRGPGTGTAPLPIYLAFFNGAATVGCAGSSGCPGASIASNYNSSNWTNSNFVNALGIYEGSPFTPAGTNVNTGLAGNATRQANSVAAGLPANFFRVNPDALGGARATGQGGYSKYDSVQFMVRRRLADGLQADANYTYGKGFGSSRYSFRVPRILTRNGDDVTHAFKATWVYDLPFGRGKRFGTNVNAWVDGVLGGWIWSGTTRIQSGQLEDLGNVRVVGMTLKEAQEAFHLRKIDGEIAFSWPQDIIDNTIRAFSTSATSADGYSALGPPSGRYFAPANGPDCMETISNAYGDCGVRSLVVTGPNLVRMDMSLRKNINFARRAQFQISFEIFNVLNRVQWGQETGIGGDEIDDFLVNIPNSSRTMQIGTRITW